MPGPNREYGKALRRYAIDNEMTHGELAALIGVSATRLSRVCNGKSEMPWTWLERMPAGLAAELLDEARLELKRYQRLIENGKA